LLADQLHPLSCYTPELSVRFKLPSAGEVTAGIPAGDLDWFDLRRGFTELGLARGFDQMLCLPTLRSVDTYWYQVETARKVLKQFRGRVLLADEVGLGKTIEAGMVVKEYLLRGMARRVLVLTPASLVGQWREELSTKFGLDFATTQDPAFRTRPEALWREPLVVASIAVARRSPHAGLLEQEAFDIVVVDEAHHLKNRRTRGYALVNALRKRFLILLSATPVQNDLLELYNILTLLKPGIFKTEKDFRAAYMKRGEPRMPANQTEMRDLMRDVMVRNTRALVDVRLPSRHAVTLRPDPGSEEADCYLGLTLWVRSRAADAHGGIKLALRNLLMAAGSSPHAAASALRRFVDTRLAGEPGDVRALAERYAAIEKGAKEKAFLDLLAKNPGERTMVFSHHRATLERLAALLQKLGLAFARFDGSMSGPEKDAAIERFRDEVPILLSTESGGEGRNVQFANTLVNFDLPWNPMTLEQRIGRLHRIGQTREVFIFNLATRNTVEDRLLRILDDKINMFELVVGEIGDILGEIDDERDFADAVFSAWIATSEGGEPGQGETAADGFDGLERALLRARERHQDAKALDDALFGDEFEAV
jgi:SNF2 family DNA or RNA helicase